MSICVIIPAAGSGKRYTDSAIAQGRDPGSITSKLDEDLGGRPVLQRTIELFANHPRASSIIVAGPHDESAFAHFKLRYADKLGLLGVVITRGGATHRHETVAAALAHAPADCTHIAVHDAARPCTPADLIDRVLDAAEHHPAVIPGIDVPDTLKRVHTQPVEQAPADPLDAILGIRNAPPLRAVQETIDRTNLVGVQTPQVFARQVLVAAYQQPNLTSTDDAQLVERLGQRVVIVPGDARNIKITTADDITLARAIMGLRPQQARATHKRF